MVTLIVMHRLARRYSHYMERMRCIEHTLGMNLYRYSHARSRGIGNHVFLALIPTAALAVNGVLLANTLGVSCGIG